MRLTRNGWRAVLAVSNTRRSDIRLSISSRAIMSPFFNAFIAKYSPVTLYWASNTCQQQKHNLSSQHIQLHLHHHRHNGCMPGHSSSNCTDCHSYLRVRNTLTSTYLSCHIKPRKATQHFRPSSLQLLQKLTTRTGNHVLDGGPDPPGEGVILREKGASQCKV